MSNFDVAEQAAKRAPLDRHVSVPVIREAAYYGPVAEYVREIAPGTESDTVAVFAQALAWAGCRIGRSVVLQHGQVAHYPIVWPLIVGATSVARKGTAEAESVTALSTLSTQPREKPEEPESGPPLIGLPRTRSGLSSGEGLIEAFLSTTQGDPPPDGRLLIVESEWETVLARTKRERTPSPLCSETPTTERP
jgi:hypothetical protein